MDEGNGIRRKSQDKGTNRDKESVEHIIESPIRSGFLLAFCEKEHNVENMNFLIAVMRFKDILYVDKGAWTRKWQDIDEDLEDQVQMFDDARESKDSFEGIETSWPSRKVRRAAAVDMMKKIVDNYIDNTAPYEICMSHKVQQNTLKRVAMINLYGPDVFAEAMVDPIKTMKKDILPRFLVSEHCARMRERLASCGELPVASELIVPPPSTTCLDESYLDDFPLDRKFSLPEFFECQILYNELLTYLRKNVCSENLLCLRSIKIYEDFMSSGEMDAAEEEAWKIYRFFIASGSAYEISIGYPQKKEVLQNMAVPKPGMYDEVKKSVLTMLRRNFESFVNTEQYQELASMLRQKKSKMSLLSKVNCFG